MGSAVSSLSQWRIQDFCEGMRLGSGPNVFSEGMTPTFPRHILRAHRRSQNFQRVGAPRGGSRISSWGHDGGAEGPESNEARSGGAPKG